MCFLEVSTAIYGALKILKLTDLKRLATEALDSNGPGAVFGVIFGFENI